ncbi:DUF4135 domain-containing protein, partial [Streptomyces sp. S9]|nr:DUF4135 domain-containing protein [Streptomyces sp. S9]
VAVIFTVLGVIGGSVLFNKYAVRDHDGINLEMTGDMARAGQIGDAALAGGLGIVCLVFVFVVFFYALGSLYDERKDRSILFWKSLPISDTQAVLSKLAWALLLAPLLAAFEGCRARDVRRTTQAYVEVGRMLWHPASLHEEDKAIERARTLFSRSPSAQAPSPEQIAVEIDDLRYGDIPAFVEPLSAQRIQATVQEWRGMRIELEEMIV